MPVVACVLFFHCLLVLYLCPALPVLPLSPHLLKILCGHYQVPFEVDFTALMNIHILYIVILKVRRKVLKSLAGRWAITQAQEQTTHEIKRKMETRIASARFYLSRSLRLFVFNFICCNFCINSITISNNNKRPI
jgi:hypothetical protein